MSLAEIVGPDKGPALRPPVDCVALHLDIGSVARRRAGKKVCVEARLLGATVGEGWSVTGELPAGLRPALILVDVPPRTAAARRLTAPYARPVRPWRPGVAR